MRLVLIHSIVLGLLSGSVCPAWAQATAAQPATVAQPKITGGLFGGRRPIDPSHPDRSAQQVTFDLDLSGGYDHNGGLQNGTFVGTDVQQTGPIGASAGEFRYRWGTSRNYLDASARANTSFAKVGVKQREAGDGQIQTAVTMGRRAGLNAAVSAAFEPTYLFNAFGALADQTAEGVIPIAALSEGFTEQRWLSSSASGSLYRNWTTRQRSDLLYGATHRKPYTGEGLDSYSQSAGLRHQWSYRERTTLQFSHQFQENRQIGGTVVDLAPLQSHVAGLSLRLQKRFSPRRAIAFSFGGGATQSRTRQTLASSAPPVNYLVPSGLFGTQLILSPRWTVSLDANRAVTVLEGLSPQPFTTDAVSLITEGSIGRNIAISASGAFSHGALTTGDTGAFQTTLGLAQLRYSLSRCCALTTTYSYYEHRVFDLITVQSGFPSQHRRNSIRLGVSFFVPLFGSFQDN